MVHILLLILKILGCLLLLLLFLLILVLLLVLLVPVRYRFSGSKYEGEMPKAQAAVTWLFSLISFNAAFGDQGLTYGLRAAWLKLIDSGGDGKEEKTKDPEEDFPDYFEEDPGGSEKLEETGEAVAADEGEIVSVPDISMEDAAETGPGELGETGVTIPGEVEKAGATEATVPGEVGKAGETVTAVEEKGKACERETIADAEPAGGTGTAGGDIEASTGTAGSEAEVAGGTGTAGGDIEASAGTETACKDAAEAGTEDAVDIEEITETGIDIKEESPGEVSPSGQAGPAPAGKEGKEAEDSLPDRLCRKIEDIGKKVEDKSVWLQEKYQQGEDLLNTFPPETYGPIVWDTAYKLLHHVIPRKLEGHVRYGFEDPYTTGRITSWTAALYPLYAGSFEVTPEFDRKILEGDLEGTGRIRLGFLVRLLISLLLKKEVRFAICYVLKLRKKSRSQVKES